tara:strand:+ start:405 stop:578 length:174 start_codon:yes stop_codon:yes gene_type:complete
MEIRNSNEVRLKLLCEDILNKKVKRATIKRYAENYLYILNKETKEKENYERTLEKTV